jgi:hypothetical protein
VYCIAGSRGIQWLHLNSEKDKGKAWDKERRQTPATRRRGNDPHRCTQENLQSIRAPLEPIKKPHDVDVLKLVEES